MSLAAGTRIGPYEIVAPLGAGGMGEVYRARDTKLNRDVALKVLPDALADDPDRRARFEREAKTLAALNHPHIAHVYGLEEAPSTSPGQSVVDAIVMELVEGQTLEDRIARGAIPVDEALLIARQIAEALEVAHDHGVIHRDLKPANIKVTPDGAVKVLDFGLAKAFDSTPGAGLASGSLANSPTITSPAMTMRGVILGTAAYMSPEQAKGMVVDKRTDIWSFGVVFYEMLTGRRLFGGETITDTMIAVLTLEPDWTRLPRNLPSSVRGLIRRCLVRDPRQRLRDMGEVRIALDPSALDDSLTEARSMTASRPQWAPWAVAAAALAALIVFALPRSTSHQPETTYLTLATPPGETETSTSGIDISRDGRRVVRAFDSGRIYLYDLDRQAPPSAVPEAVGTTPAFSPDGRSMAYRADKAMMTVPVEGGRPQVLVAADHSGSFGGTWGDDNRLLVTLAWRGSVRQVSADGSQVETMFGPDPAKGEVAVVWPSRLPDGRILYTGGGYAEKVHVAVFDPATKARTILVDGASDGRYVAPGYLLYAQANRLIGRAFRLSTLALGAPVTLAEGLLVNPGSNRAHYALSATGVLVYLHIATTEQPLLEIDRTGRRRVLPNSARSYNSDVALSPDGSRIAATAIDALGQIAVWVYDIAAADSLALSQGKGWDMFPGWSPDGRSVVWHSERQDGYYAMTRSADASVPERPLLTTKGQYWRASWHAGGKVVATYGADEERHDIWVFSLDDQSHPEPVATTGADEDNGKLSPNGRLIAYESNESGRNEIYVRPYPRPADWVAQVTRDGGANPHWSSDGRRISFSSGSHAMMVDITLGAPVAATRPTIVFDGLPGSWDVSGDGKTYVAVEPPPAPQLMVALNWLEELKRRVPPLPGQ
jgi:serine/threonine protein kinase/Tol biopolymer transport system component